MSPRSGTSVRSAIAAPDDDPEGRGWLTFLEEDLAGLGVERPGDRGEAGLRLRIEAGGEPGGVEGCDDGTLVLHDASVRPGAGPRECPSAPGEGPTVPGADRLERAGRECGSEPPSGER